MAITAATTKAKAKTTKVSKETKPSVAKASHPPYFQMIKEAILALKERGGSSPQAIAKYMEEKFKPDLPANFKKIMSVQLKKSVVKGKLVKVKASFKLSDESKKEKSTKTAIEKKPKAAAKPTPAADVSAKTKAVKKPATKKKVATTVKPVKKAGVKKSMKSNPVKKSTPVKLKQLKSIKSPAAKKSKKA
ncbi:Histone h1 [Thalictrum thalictroides]|uniref:Histone h1 n=1 Tax=Thalictrum thalictroides TaxID=46969 RepID=A0A7J6VGE6_THATH|nr:Histone h1 [Thalictrum thalictroides]